MHIERCFTFADSETSLVGAKCFNTDNETYLPVLFTSIIRNAGRVVKCGYKSVRYFAPESFQSRFTSHASGRRVACLIGAPTSSRLVARPAHDDESGSAVAEQRY